MPLFQNQDGKILRLTDWRGNVHIYGAVGRVEAIAEPGYVVLRRVTSQYRVWLVGSVSVLPDFIQSGIVTCVIGRSA